MKKRLSSVTFRHRCLTSPVETCALGVLGALTLSSSEAAIFYVNANNLVTADNLPNDGFSVVRSIDLDGDGTVDLRLRNLIETGTGANLAQVFAPAGGTLDLLGAAFGASNFLYPDRLAINKGVDASAAFVRLAGNTPGSMAYGAGFVNSKWITSPANTGYLGLRFTISGQPHYGWMRLTVDNNTAAQPRAITLHEWAYETTPNAGILTGAVPEPGGLGLLALGSTGIALHRRRKPRQAS
jgi:PEP-CTERM motif